MDDKLKEFQENLQLGEFDAFFVTNVTNVYYLTNFLSRSYTYLVAYPDSTPVLFVPELEYEDAASTVKNSKVVKIDRNTEILPTIKKDLEKNKIKILGIEDNSMSVRVYLEISEKFDFLELENGSFLLDNLRITKTKEEIKNIKEACRIADIGVTAAVENISLFFYFCPKLNHLYETQWSIIKGSENHEGLS